MCATISMFYPPSFSGINPAYWCTCIGNVYKMVLGTDIVDVH
jgi:hypothetical protein